MLIIISRKDTLIHFLLSIHETSKLGIGKYSVIKRYFSNDVFYVIIIVNGVA